jgi:hypothetical protein
MLRTLTGFESTLPSVHDDGNRVMPVLAKQEKEKLI